MLTLNGRPCHRGGLHVPWQGRWLAQVALDGALPSGKVTLLWGKTTLAGTVDPTSAGTWQGEARATIIGGIGWSNVLPALWLQNDAGLLGSAVAQQAATLAGETLVAPATAFRALRVSYSRPKRQASAALADVLADGAAWWVEFDGTTKAGVRPLVTAPARVDVLSLDPREGVAELDADDPGQVLVGSVMPALPPRRPSAYRIVEVQAALGPDGQRITAWLEVFNG